MDVASQVENLREKSVCYVEGKCIQGQWLESNSLLGLTVGSSGRKRTVELERSGVYPGDGTPRMSW